MNQVVDFAALYAGHTGAFGSDWGSCVREPLTLARYHAHLMGTQPIGVYPLRPVNGQTMVKWTGTDIDVEDIGMALSFAGRLDELGVFPHVERSRSKGYHVLVFLSDWTPAVVARHAMLHVHEVTGIPPTEPYPKQDELTTAKPFGNYLRLAYPGGLVNAKPDRQVMLWPGGIGQSLDQFLTLAKNNLCAPERLAEIAECYTSPEPRYVAPGANAGPIQWPESEASTLAQKAGGLAWTIFSEGPLEGSDRSTTMARLAHILADGGLSPTEAFKVLAGLSWSKFLDRPDHDAQVLKLIEQAWT